MSSVAGLFSEVGSFIISSISSVDVSTFPFPKSVVPKLMFIPFSGGAGIV